MHSETPEAPQQSDWHDVRSAILDEVQSLSPLDDQERADIARAKAWLAGTAQIWRIAKPATPPQHLIAYFLIVDGDRILLGDHVNSGRWLPGGGHVDPGEHPRTTVAREVMEEFGIPAQFIVDAPLLLSFVDTVGITAGHTDVCVWYALCASADQAIEFDRREFRTIRWFTEPELAALDTDPALGRALQKLRRL